MPKYRSARRPVNVIEERHVRTLAHSAHAPADGICHAQMVVRSWEGLRPRQIAEDLPQTVRERLHAFQHPSSILPCAWPRQAGRQARRGTAPALDAARTQNHPGTGEAAPAGQAHRRTN